jgi:NAD(P)-dependent dehydrogenase (short-subunit alcohol dehydrogenase family)
MKRLNGKVAVVLGAAGKANMGQAIARQFAAEGAKVVVAGRHLQILAALASETAGAAQLCDVTQKQNLDRGFRVTPVTSHRCFAGELRRAADTLGMTGVILQSFCGQRSIEDPYFEPAVCGTRSPRTSTAGALNSARALLAAT